MVPEPLNSAEPAQNTSAPARAAAPIVARPIPPSTSSSISETAAVDFGSGGGDLAVPCRQVPLAAEAGVDRHHQQQVNQIEDVGHGFQWRRRVERDTGTRTEIGDGDEGSVQVPEPPRRAQ